MTTKIRESKGGAYTKRGQHFVRVTVGPQKRQAEHAPWAATLEEAAERGRLVQTWVNRLRLAGQTDFVEKLVEQGAEAADEKHLAAVARNVDVLTEGRFDPVEPPKKTGGPVTFRTFAERWTGGELAKIYPDHIEEKSSVQDDIERLEKHVYPHVQDVVLVKFTRAHADGVMAKLSPALERGTRRQVAQVVSRVLHLAVFTGEIPVHPLPRGWLPKAPKADAIAKEAVLPSEEADLLRGRNADGDVVVPLVYRVLYAFLDREGPRKGEGEGFAWPDFDLDNGVVSLDDNKTDRPRSWVLDPGVLKMLVAWKEISGGKAGPVFPGIKWGKLAPTYRDHCKAVGIDRARLFEKKKGKKLQLRAHDMRAFFVTAGMFAGKDAMWLTDRTGHTTLSMLRRYERDVRRWRELGEAPVNAATAIPEVAAAITAAERGGNAVRSDRRGSASARKCTGRDLNPYASRRRNLKTDEREASSVIPQDSGELVSEPPKGPAASSALPPRFAAASGPSDADLERGILDALAKGLDAVAKSLSAQLDARQRFRAGNLIKLSDRRPR